MLSPIPKEFYGDNHRWFFATVINAHPPVGLEGRVKVRINGVHNPKVDQIPERDLPWAQVLIPTTDGGVSGLGRIPQIQAGAFVFGVFLDGTTSQIPLILGSLPRVETPTDVQTGRSVDVENAYNYQTQRYQNVVTGNILYDGEAYADYDLRRQQCMKFFIDNGYPILQASAITGALEGASGFITYAEEGDDLDNEYIGIARWRRTNLPGARYFELLQFAREYEPSSNWRLFSIQLQFVLFELRNRFSQVNGELLRSTDIETASELLNRKYIIRTTNTTNLAERAYNEVLNG